MTTKKVLVVDDSAFMRKMISDILSKSSNLEVISTARNGEDALKKVTELKPDVITLDIEMPIKDGIATLRDIMKHQPTPVVMLSSLTKAGADKTMEAMSNGAVDFIAKPSGSISLDIEEISAEIIRKVEAASLARIKPKKDKKRQEIGVLKPVKAKKKIVLIGSSTGGPSALQEVLTKLPKDFPAPIAIVQHMPKGFTKSLAERLNRLAEIEVREVTHLEELKPGIAYIAPGGQHFLIEERQNKYIARVTDDQPVKGHKPSVNLLFNSAAELRECLPVSVMLTGMGSDGASGIELLKRKHPRTIAISQSKESCIVYGMPQAAEKTGLVDYVVDISEISNVLTQKFMN
ncbi:two-component system chemotaxis response regulator CheB [Gracilibacillus halotolerans]|uniref:Protein-glutamate methylesterase/protein-glutamine glutaminase n=1 Tax=Gracilibacillus halotolerans TaxID=74386 RepID=A0A841RL44_9BACI|nr:chemotaxis response regulator protein-glutamate methylesterase [Gracilibacillus halotolerans]MBB6511458.1 two-component system chemotaxis response regulator CheB [Gracilibacillus halotolerans]